jgi:hypothetical protein
MIKFIEKIRKKLKNPGANFRWKNNGTSELITISTI